MNRVPSQSKKIMILAMLAALTLIAGLRIAGAHQDSAYSHDASIGYTNKNWMAALPDDTPLSGLSVPGTHDSMAYQIVGPATCWLDNDITLTQSMDLETQLNSGIRALDIRGFHQDNRLQMHHGECDLGADLGDVMSTVNTWLAENDTETILMHVKREWLDHESGNTRSYVNTFDAYMDSYGSRLWNGTGDNPLLKDLRGKIVILEDFSNGDQSRYSNLDWETFDFQNEWKMECHNELYAKWQAVQGQLDRAASLANDVYYQDEIFVNFLSAAYNAELGWSIVTVGSCVVDPYFVASGHKKPATDSQRKDTGADDSNPPNYSLYPDFPRTSCQNEIKSLGIVWQKSKCDIEYEGTNILTADYLAAQAQVQRVGIILADFPGKELIEQVIRMNPPAVNQPPVANVTGPNGADPFVTHEGWLEFDASGSTDPEDDRLQYIWDLNSDGQWETTWSYYDEKFGLFVGHDWSGTVTVGVYDGQGDADARASYDTLAVTVINEPPTIDSFTPTNRYTYAEGETAVISGTWSDHLLGEPGETYAGLALWSDEFDTRELTLNADGTFETRRDLVNILGLGNVSKDLNVEIIIYDSAGGRGSAFSPDITISHNPPTIDTFSMPSRIQEGATAVVRGTFSDPVYEACDTRTYYEGTALWSDGIWTDLVANLDGTFETSRTFKDDFKQGGASGTAEDAFAVTITIYDFCRNPASRTTPALTVENAAPIIGPVSVDELQLAEGSTVNVSGVFTDRALGVATEFFQGRALWSDGVNTPVTIDADAGTFAVSRQFGDVGPTPEAYTLQIAISDDDGGTSNIKTTPTITVRNAAPQIDQIQVPDHPFFEGQEAVVYGTFSDPAFASANETYSGYALWSDGFRTDVTFHGRIFRANRLFPDDNPSGTPYDDYTVSIFIADDDGGVGDPTTSPPLRIRNANPVTAIDSLTDETGAAVATGVYNLLVHTRLNLQASFTDAGAYDSHTATVDWGDGKTNSGSSAGTIAVPHTYGAAGVYTINVEVVDDDTGAGSAAASITVVESAAALDALSTELSGYNAPAQAVATALSDTVERVAAGPYGDGQAAADLIAEAVAKLTGPGGAVQLLGGGSVNDALVKMWQAMRSLQAAEAADPNLNLTPYKNVLALSAKSSAMTVILDAAAAADTDRDSQKIAEAYALIAAGDEMRAASNFLDAMEMYRLAAQEAQGINVEE